VIADSRDERAEKEVQRMRLKDALHSRMAARMRVQKVREAANG